MNVVELSAVLVKIPLKKPIRHASHTRTETDNLLVRCVLSDGSTGYGEGVPREYVTGETAEGALRLLQGADYQGQLRPCRDFADAVEMVENFRVPAVPGDDRECAGNAARCAVELAMLDAYGRAFGEPLSRVTQLLAPDLYQFRDRVQYSGAITSAKGFKARVAGWKMWGYGFRQVKVKVGIDGHDDPARLRSIRKGVGRKVDLRIDANEAWTPQNAAQKIRELLPHGITSVEQPLPHADAAHLKALRESVPVPIMLDESLCSRVDGERAVRGGWCDLFNLRLSKCGGFIPSLRLAQLAARNGLGYQLGCQVGETCLLSAAGRHFACSVGVVRYLEGSYDRHLVREALGTHDVTFRRAGWAAALVGCGLGVELDPAALQRVTFRAERLFGG